MKSILTRHPSQASKFFSFAVLGFALMCGSGHVSAAGESLIGTWQHVNYPKRLVIISKDGPRLAIVVYQSNLRGGYNPRAPIPADIKGDTAVVSPYESAVLRENGNLLYRGGEYIRAR